MREFIIADNQDITKAGMMFLLSSQKEMCIRDSAYTPAKTAVIPLRDTNLEDLSINSFISFTDSIALFLSIYKKYFVMQSKI